MAGGSTNGTIFYQQQYVTMTTSWVRYKYSFFAAAVTNGPCYIYHNRLNTDNSPYEIHIDNLSIKENVFA